jgi:hypothetical protein
MKNVIIHILFIIYVGEQIFLYYQYIQRLYIARYWRIPKIFYDPVHVSHNQHHRDAAQSRASDVAQFKICCRGKSFMNFDASRFQKY